MHGATLAEAAAVAGGLKPDADGQHAVLTRSDGQGVSVSEIDIESFLAGGAQGAAPAAQDGDSIFVPEFAHHVLVMGEVARPGAYKLQRGAKLLDAIAAAGGATAGASLDNVTVYAEGRPDQADKRTIGEGRALFAGSAHDNPELSPGDMVVVGSRAIKVSVVGRVARPGAYELLSGARIVDALAAAGGMASGADADSVVYSRSGSEPGSVTLDAEALLRDPSLDANALLADGDALFVPEAREQVAIMGEVARPGVYPAGRGTTLMDILAAAGGPTDRADLRRVKVYEGQSAEPAGDRESDPAGLSLAVAHESLVYEGDMRSNPPVMPGQVVVVPSSAIRVQVVGQVQRPGSYELKRGAGIVEAITAAGGVSTAGDGTKVVVTRRGGESDGEGSVGGAKGSSNEARAIEIDVDAILAGGAAGLELADGDTVYVPELSGQVVVLGEVARPGAYRLPRGAKLADAVAAAGGLTARASLENVTIYAGGDASVGAGAAIGQGKVLFAGDGAANPTLGADDVVVVGSRMINVTVVGAAARPGVYELAVGARLLDAVAAAGGVSALGDAKSVALTRGTGGRTAGADSGAGRVAAGIDLDALGHDPGGEANAVLTDGDVVYIPEAPEKLKKQVAVLGAVARPGVYPVDEGTRLMEAIAAAGGPLDMADLGRVKVYRAGEPAEGVDLEVADDRLVYDGDIKANPVVEPSSVIVVPGTEVRVYVAGFVARPGQVTLRRGATALDAIAAAGGVTSAGDGTRVALARKTGEGAFSLEIDVMSAFDAPETSGEAAGKPPAKAPTAPLPLLEDGDALFVPEAVPAHTLVLGEVARPGAYQLQRGAKLLDAIAAAGGATARASLDNVTVYAAGKPDQAGKRAIGEGRALFAGKAHDNPELSPGDMVVVGSRAIYVSVVGRVARPGTYELLSGARIADALAAAGGMASGADAGAVVHSRRGSQPGSTALDAEALLRDPRLDANALLADGDALFVPEAREQVAIMGEVTRPGVYPAGRGTTLMDLLAAAGGPTGKADLARVKVYEGQGVKAVPAADAGGDDSRPGGLTALSLAVADESLVYEGNIKANPPVMAGQVIVVPSSGIRVQVAGHVQRPGSYELKRGADVAQAITAAGGVSTAGNGTRVVVTRRGGEGDSEGSIDGAEGSSNAARAVEIDIDAILAGGAASLELADGDTVYVPEAVPEQVVVLGEVARPGAYKLPRGAKLADAVAAAGGLTARASLENVTIYAGGDASVGTGAAIGQGKVLFAGHGAANPTLGASDVVVVGSRMINVTVVGAAARPGVYELAAGARLLDAVAAAGGASALGDGKNIVLTRGAGGRASGADSGAGQIAAGIDLDALGHDPGSEGNAVLGDGDVVYIPEAPEKLKKQVAVLGAVARPGVYPVDEGTRLMETIAAAGGPLDAADLTRVKVYRGGEPAEGMDLEVADDRLVYDGDIKANPGVEPSSVIVVPGTEVRVYVAGFVARPGQVTMRRGATALDAIAAAGGVTSAGDGTRVALARKIGDSAFSLEIDVTAVLDARESPDEPSGQPPAKVPTAPLPLLEDGDALFVPEAAPGQAVVLGEVARPGSYKVAEGTRVLDLIAAAGGVTPKASLEKISVFPEGVLTEPRYISIGTGKSLLPEGAADNPEVRAGDVIVVASRMLTVNVIGAVARPGTFELQPGASLVDAVAAAGGTRADADAARVSVARKPSEGATKSEILTVDLEAAIGGAGAQALLADGDVIFVPEMQGQVLVLGEVTRPGAYELPREARLLDAIAAAGGTTAKASLESVTVYKDGALAAGTVEPLGHGKVLFFGKVTENPRVSPGDVVTVGSRMIDVSVIGRAVRPGSYELPLGSRVIDAVAAAGGVAPDADRRSVLVIPAGKPEPSATVDLDQALRGGDVGHILSDGDVVFIPDTRQQIAVMGEVTRPGVYAYTEGMTLMEVMAMAGGPSAKADLARVRLYRGERVEDALRLEVADDRLAFEGDIKNNPALAPGDILFVPSGRIRVQVAGHIARTGEVELRRGATILDAISAAGGLAQAGDGARVVVTRKGEGAGRVFEVDVDGLLRGGIPQAEAPGLEDGDVVFVPEANRKIAVMGGVARPGLYDYKTGMKLIECLAMAGGPTAAARLDRVMVYSGDQAVQIALGDAKAKAMTIDPTKGNNPELKSGDIIIVPLSEKIDWSMIISILSAINQIKGIITR